jgi:hypothetical protein
MSHIIQAYLEEGPPVVFVTQQEIETTVDIDAYISQAWKQEVSSRCIGFSKIPNDGYPYRFSKRYVVDEPEQEAA